MKKLLPFLICFTFIGLYCHALEDSTSASFAWSEKKPKFLVKINTMDKRIIKGLLVGINDTTVVLFPGKLTQWKNRSHYHPLYVADTSISLIKLKNKNAIGTGAAAGAIVGAFPIYDAFSGDNVQEGLLFLSLFTIPAGAIVGALTGAAFGDKFEIRGQHESFQKFKNKFNPEP